VPDLPVVEGSPRVAAALAPGESVTLSYTVVTRRGEHEFDGPLVRARSLSASERHTRRLDVETGTTLTCGTPARDRLTETVMRRVGQLSAGGRGEGTEFHATREYRRGDPMRRIDWRHVAKTGEFVTVEYRDQEATRTAVVVDIRGTGRRRPAPGHPSGVTLSIEAADRLLTALDRANVLAGCGVAGVDPDGPLATVGNVAWADNREAEPALLLQEVRDTVAAADGSDAFGGSADRPSGTAAGTDGSSDRRVGARTDGGPTDSSHRTDGRARSRRRTDPESRSKEGASGGSTRSQAGSRGSTAGGADRHTDAGGSVADADESIERLLDQLPPRSQVVLCTPALDDWAVTFGRVATARGHGLVVVSPDVTTADDVGSRLADLRRRRRLRTLAQLSEVVDWTPGRSVSFDTGGVS
jgi:uncharacterized protein (DUF58 family)